MNEEKRRALVTEWQLAGEWRNFLLYDAWINCEPRPRRGRPPKYIYGEDTLEDVRRSLADVELTSPLKRGALKEHMASEPGNPGNGRSQKWKRRKETIALLEAARNRPINPD